MLKKLQLKYLLSHSLVISNSIRMTKARKIKPIKAVLFIHQPLLTNKQHPAFKFQFFHLI